MIKELKFLINIKKSQDNAMTGLVKTFESLGTEGLKALADKIVTMVKKGDNPNIMPMLAKIATGRIKTLYKVNKYSAWVEKESLGKGHFRWNYKAYTLTEKEIAFLKMIIK